MTHKHRKTGKFMFRCVGCSLFMTSGEGQRGTTGGTGSAVHLGGEMGDGV
jgi:hypothetical protein